MPGVASLSLSARRAWIEISIFFLYRSLRLVALRKESVDRNDTVQIVIIVVETSLSARRAWIEIRQQPAGEKQRTVALRKESVDRNETLVVLPKQLNRSLSARRAWIEIAGQPAHGLPSIGRSPQGERG